MAPAPELNFHHLRCFWALAREGSIAGAGALLKLSQPTISEQVRSLARALGAELFVRDGRRLRLTAAGRTALGYADEIFALGRELGDSLAGGGAARRIPVAIGVGDALSKLIACRLIAPVLRLDDPVQVTVHEGAHDALVQRLAAQELDLVLSDAPLEPHLRIRAFNHLLGESRLAVFGAARYAALARGFPRSLSGAPLLAPLPGTPLRRAWDAWSAERGLALRIVAQIEDSALLKTLGQEGFGVFLAPEAIADDIRRTFRVRHLGTIPELRQRVYGISPERRLANPAVQALTAGGRRLLG